MSCQEIQAQLVDLFDGRLDAATELRLHAHVESCAACREHVATWSALLPAMRELAPTPPKPFRQKRMEDEIERRLADAVTPPDGRSRQPLRITRKMWIATAAGVAAAAALTLVLRAPRPHAPAAFAVVAAHAGVEERTLAAGTTLTVTSGEEETLSLAAGATVQLSGPAELGLAGDGAEVALRLVSGKLRAEVAHRASRERFVVALPDGKIEVRGTRFTAFAGAESWVDVEEGQVVVSDGEGEHAVAKGQRYAFAHRAAPAAAAIRPVPATHEAEPTPLASNDVEPTPAALQCAPTDCRKATAKVRAAMGRRDFPGALALIHAALRAGGCPARQLSCRDELGYLNAEVLRLAGEIDRAVTIYKSLDRAGAPPSMRQNALYSAAQLERRTGQLRAAGSDFEAARAASPKGALSEEALLGAMETAAQAGDSERAKVLAQRYAMEYPQGMGAASAKRIQDHHAVRGTAP